MGTQFRSGNNNLEGRYHLEKCWEWKSSIHVRRKNQRSTFLWVEKGQMSHNNNLGSMEYIAIYFEAWRRLQMFLVDMDV